MAQRTDDGERLCRGCGLHVRIIKTGGLYNTVMVEADPVRVIQQTGGEAFITGDGRTIFGFQAGDADDDPDSGIKAYIPHKGRCPNGGRKRRVKK
jgi:hypothetical protein